MKRTFLNLSSVNNQSWACEEVIEQYHNIINDPKKEERIKSCYCRLCYYRSVVSTANCPETDCAICKKKFYWHCGNVPAICKECAKENKLCIQCGADREYKRRTKDTWNK